MCVQEKEQVSEGIMENLGGNGISSGNDVDDEDCKPWSLHSQVELSPAQNETWGKNTSFDHPSPLRNSSPVRRKTFFGSFPSFPFLCSRVTCFFRIILISTSISPL